MVFIILALLVDMLHQSKSDLREVKLANHGVTDCITLAFMQPASTLQLTFVKGHVPALDFRACETGKRHIIHDDFDIGAGVGKLSVDDLEDNKARLCGTLVSNS